MQEQKPVSESNVEQLRAQALKDPAVVVATGFGIGWIPFAPGTIASLVMALLFFFVTPDSVEARLILHYAIVFLLFIGARISIGSVVKKYGPHDAPCVVVDEFLGMAIALFLVPTEWWAYVVAFVVFRIFDIVKPWPISWVEKKISGVYGVILDDVIAAAIALAITHLLCLTNY
ncbi:MAG: phosphatidylglycerophosphatase A [Gammaproteobacteria bacterium]|nr:phosphatidylglycerophosphatase A [Gammaproteobacteria bacterium]MYF38843.1 phosphatidylglycerophosphatase A [Gammaproteobacteria bacterium]